jgi:putative chitinase
VITEKHLQLLGVDVTWCEPLNAALALHGINTKLRVCHFMAQCLHESSNFKILSENLNYSQQGLRKVFPKYFPDDATAFRYARQPAAIANRVYGGRMGNGGEASGEGYKYRGRGLIQLTGKDNYTNCSKFLFGDLRLVDDPDYVSSKEGAVLSACWYWVKNNLNKIADDDNIELMTLRINGGKIGLADRIHHLEKCKEIINGN